MARSSGLSYSFCRSNQLGWKQIGVAPSPAREALPPSSATWRSSLEHLLLSLLLVVQHHAAALHQHGIPSGADQTELGALHKVLGQTENGLWSSRGLDHEVPTLVVVVKSPLLAEAALEIQ